MRKWLKDAVLYQIYPTSFYDSNGDGVGDLQGITQKLDYVKSLGVDIIWLNPVYKSPFKDGGYDIADYRQIDRRFGTMADFDALIQKANALGLKICMDLVIGHTSWDCDWFQKSAQEEKNQYSDYYIWTDSIFTTYKNKTISGLYDRNGCFYVNYYACQPALNFGFNDSQFQQVDEESYGVGNDWKMHYTDARLEPLRQELYSIVDFWMARGVAGFRVDMANSLVKGCTYDSDRDEDIAGLIWFWNTFFTHVRSKHPEAFFISEWVYPKNAVGKCGFDIDLIAHDNAPWNSLFRCEQGTNLLPDFETGNNYFSANAKGTVEQFLQFQQDVNETIRHRGFFSAPSGSHDEIRLATGKSEAELKTVFAFLLTTKHVPFLYYGDEIGMVHNFEVSRDGGYIRTGARTPMQWDAGCNRGFSVSQTPYLPTNALPECSVSAQACREDSLLNTVKALIHLRKAHPCLGAGGGFEVVECHEGGYPLRYERTDGNERIQVVISPGREALTREIPHSEVLASSNCKIEGHSVTISNSGYAILRMLAQM